MNYPNLKEARKRTNSEIDFIKLNFNLNEFQENIGIGKKCYVKTYGCQMNEHDSENIKAILELMGYTNIDNYEEADLIILNTCAIRENAHNKVFGLLGRIKHLRQTRKVVVGFCGCMAQEEEIVNELTKDYKWVDFIFGTHNIHELPSILEKALKEHKQQVMVYSCEGSVVEDIPVKRDSKYKAWVNIMYGCDKFCTYCIVPYTRGRQRSRHHEDILKEVETLKENGYKEITLLGQNVNAYGKDLNDNYGMSDLLKDVALTGIPRIRFVTSHPWDFNDDMIKVISTYENIMPYIHLPLQSGSDKILKLMGRRYTKEEYLRLYDKLKSAMPNCSITTDIIVGFPGEDENDFNDTLDVVNYCKYDSAFTFIFSPRIGTPAAKMTDNVSLEEKENRLYRLNDLVNKYSRENNMKYQDKIVDVLLEEKSNKEGYLKGYTDTMKLVNVKCDESFLGSIVPVKINDIKTWSMDGVMVDIKETIK